MAFGTKKRYITQLTGLKWTYKFNFKR